MINWPQFQQALKVGDEISLVLLNGLISGKIKEIDENKDFVKISEANIFGTQLEIEMTVYIENLDILGWGKK